MKYLIAILVFLFLVLTGIALASHLDPLTLDMAVGMVFGVLAGVPVALLTLAANNRRADEDDAGPPPPRQSAIVLDAPVAPAAPALPAPTTRRATWTQAQARRLLGYQYVDDARTQARLAACGVKSLPCAHALLTREDVAILRVYYDAGHYAKAALPLTAQAATAARRCCDDPAAIAVEVHHGDDMIFAWMRPTTQPAAGSQLARRPSCHVRPQPPRLRQAADDDDDYYEAVTVEEELAAATQPANWDDWGDDDDPADPPDAWGDDEDGD